MKPHYSSQIISTTKPYSILTMQQADQQLTLSSSTASISYSKPFEKFIQRESIEKTVRLADPLKTESIQKNPLQIELKEFETIQNTELNQLKTELKLLQTVSKPLQTKSKALKTNSNSNTLPPKTELKPFEKYEEKIRKFKRNLDEEFDEIDQIIPVKLNALNASKLSIETSKTIANKCIQKIPPKVAPKPNQMPPNCRLMMLPTFSNDLLINKRYSATTTNAISPVMEESSSATLSIKSTLSTHSENDAKMPENEQENFVKYQSCVTDL